MIRRHTTFSLVAAMLFLTSPALADVAPGPCDMKAEGDACMTLNNESGTCVNDAGCSCLVCQVPAGTSSGAGGSDSSNEPADDSGCSVNPSGHGTIALSFSLLMAAAVLAWRRQKLPSLKRRR